MGKSIIRRRLGKPITLIYGFKNQNAFDKRYKPVVARWNRVLGRIVADKKMTENNKSAIADIKKDFSNFNELVEVAKERQKVKAKHENI